MNTWPTNNWHLTAGSKLEEQGKRFEEELKRNLPKVPFTHLLALKKPYSREFVEIGQAGFILDAGDCCFAFYYIGSEKLVDKMSYNFIPDGALLIPKPFLVKWVIAEEIQKLGITVIEHNTPPESFPPSDKEVFVWDDGQRVVIRVAKGLPDEEDVPVYKAIINLRGQGLYMDVCEDLDEECDFCVWLSTCHGMFLDRSFSHPERVKRQS